MLKERLEKRLLMPPFLTFFGRLMPMHSDPADPRRFPRDVGPTKRGDVGGGGGGGGGRLEFRLGPKLGRLTFAFLLRPRGPPPRPYRRPKGMRDARMEPMVRHGSPSSPSERCRRSRSGGPCGSGRLRFRGGWRTMRPRRGRGSVQFSFRFFWHLFVSLLMF